MGAHVWIYVTVKTSATNLLNKVTKASNLFHIATENTSLCWFTRDEVYHIRGQMYELCVFGAKTVYAQRRK